MAMPDQREFQETWRDWLRSVALSHNAIAPIRQHFVQRAKSGAGDEACCEIPVMAAFLKPQYCPESQSRSGSPRQCGDLAAAVTHAPTGQDRISAGGWLDRWNIRPSPPDQFSLQRGASPAWAAWSGGYAH